MKPQYHFILGIILVTVLYFAIPTISILNLSILFFSSILIDADHYLYYIFKKGDKSLIHAYKWYTESRRKVRHLKRKERKKISFGFHFLHGTELLLITYILYVSASGIFLYMLFGFGFHLFIDLTEEIIKFGRAYKVSIIYSYFMNKKLKFIDDIDSAILNI